MRKQGQARVAESRPSSPSGPQRSRIAALEAKRTSSLLSTAEKKLTSIKALPEKLAQAKRDQLPEGWDEGLAEGEDEDEEGPL